MTHETRVNGINGGIVVLIDTLHSKTKNAVFESSSPCLNIATCSANLDVSHVKKLRDRLTEWLVYYGFEGEPKDKGPWSD